MPRNASGTYTLPTGNPVVSGTLIDATWANNTLNDVANTLTGSLSRSGEGGMLAPLRLNDGVQATPGIAFSNEPSTGLYRAGTNEMWAVAGGTQVLQVTNNGAAARFAAGAVGTPSITALGDLNTGLWFPAADTVALSTNGVERWRVGSGGDIAFDTNVLFVDATNNRVGVGTASPNAVLESSGTSNGSTIELLRLNNAGTGANTATQILFRAAATNYADIIGGYGASAPRLSFNVATAGYQSWAVGGTDRMTLDASGNLGIGTASLGARLHVQGNQFRQNDATNTFGYVINTTSSTTTLATLFGGSSFAIQTGGSGTNQLFLDSSGNLGIGTASPGQKLEVAGNQRFTGSQVGTKIENRQTAVSVTGATTILDDAGGLGRLVVVNGESGANRFCDLVLASTGASPTVVASFTAIGTPAARTYTRSGSALQLAMASGTYTVSALALGY